MLEDVDLNGIRDVEQARQCIVRLLNLIEDLQADNWKLREEIQHLRDENHRLKGEQGKPDIPPNQESKGSKNHSSEPERKEPKAWKKSRKVEKIPIDREQVLEVNVAQLPPDAEFKGYEEVVVQDIRIQTDNVLFRKEKYYSTSQRATYLAPLPRGYDGQFGPGVKSLAIVLYFAGNMTEPKILEFFQSVGIQISKGQLSHFLIKGQQPFLAEKDAVYEAGLRSSPWQHIDDTATRVNGQNQHCQIVCNPLYTAYFTTAKKDRMTVLDVLRNFRERNFRLNAEAFRFLDIFGLSCRVVRELKRWPQEKDLSEREFLGLLEEHLPDLGPQQRSRVLERRPSRPTMCS